METGTRNPLTDGFFDYNDAATAITPINLVANTYAKLTCNNLGPNTLKTFAPPGVTDIWNPTTNQFDFTQLRLGDQVDFRIDFFVTTSSPNQVVALDMMIGIGDPGAYTLSVISDRQYKTSGQKHVVQLFSVYMGDATTMNFPTELQIKSDAVATVIVSGWYCRIVRPKG